MSEPQWLSPSQVCDPLPGMTEEIRPRGTRSDSIPRYFKPNGNRGKAVLYDRAEVIDWVVASKVVTRPGLG